MTTRSTKLAADLVPPAEPALRHRVDSVEDRRVRWRLALDSAWHCKIDEVIALSRACCRLTPDDNAVRVSTRLQARTERAYDDLAAIEDALARIEDGTYGTCAGCDQAMSDEWLADRPEVRYCPDCALRRVSRPRPDSPEAPPPAAVARCFRHLMIRPAASGG
jgi:RNA polymerase-binding transcription factor DksA